MTDVHLHNPVGRLYSLVVYTLGQGPRSSQKSPIATHTWANYLKVDVADQPAMFRMLARVVEMPALARDCLDGIDTAGVPLDRFLGPVERVGAQVLGAAASRITAAQFAGQITDADVVQLETVSFMVNKNRGTTEVAKETLDQIRDLLTEIRDLIVNDDSIDGSLRTAVLLATDRLQRSIDLYKIGGMDAIADEVDKLVGFTARHHLATGQKPPRTFMERLIELAKVVALASAAIAGPAQAIDAAAVYGELLSGSASTEVLAPGETPAPPSA